jgi:hypothetical protein
MSSLCPQNTPHLPILVYPTLLCFTLSYSITIYLPLTCQDILNQFSAKRTVWLNHSFLPSLLLLFGLGFFGGTGVWTQGLMFVYRHSTTWFTPSAHSLLEYILWFQVACKVLRFQYALHCGKFIFCANLTGPQGAQAFGQTLFWMYLWGCFWMRLTFESRLWGKEISLPKVVWSKKELSRTKAEREGTPARVLELSMDLFLPLGWNWNWFFLGLKLDNFQDRTNIIGYPGSSASWL